MTKYDKIYVPVPEKEISASTKALSEFFMNKPLKAIPNVIVLTIEELRAVFNAGYDFAKNVPGNKDFEEFLTFKGIEI